MGWIIIPNWDRFQHYGDRRQPPWIKLYLSLVYDDAFQSLSSADKSALILLWITYARCNRCMRDDTLMLTRATGQRFTKRTLERLSDAGFVDISASKPLALEVEVEVEEKNLRKEQHDLFTELHARVNNADNDPEPPTDPDRAAKMREFTDRIGRRIE